MSTINTAAPATMCFQKNHQCGFRSRTSVSPSLMSFGGYGGMRRAYCRRLRSRCPVPCRRPSVACGVVDPDALLADLYASQRRAVTETAQSLAILAPAGSGKTRVLTRRIAWQAATEAIEPSHTLALTFTRKAAGELRTRLRKLGIRDDPTAGTFHAVALAQLRALHEHRGSRKPELLDRKARLIAPLVGRSRGAESQVAILEVAGEIEWAQARLAGPAAYADVAARAGRTPKLTPERVADVYRRYQEEKRKRALIDFDDLIRLTAQALENDAEFAATQRWRFRHLFVDEF